MINKITAFTFFCLLFFQSILFSQANAWRMHVADFSNGFQIDLPDAPMCQAVTNDILRLTHTSDNYYPVFTYNAPMCVTNDLTFEYRLKNGQNYGGKWAYDIGFSFSNPQNEISGCLMSNDARGLPYTYLSVNNQKVLQADARLVRNFDDWVTIKVRCLNSVATFYADNVELFSAPYTGSFCSITKLHFWFKGSGGIDWIRITNTEDARVVYYEDFSNCNSIKSPTLNCSVPTATVQANTPCAGDTLRIIPTTSRAATFEWAGPNGFTARAPSVVIPKTDSSAGGTYSLQARFNACQIITATVAVRIKPLPKPNLGKDTVSCDISGIAIAASGGGTYTWNNGSNTRLLNITESGSYAVTVTSTEGCKAADTIRVDVPTAVLRTDLTNVAPNCFGQCDGSIRAKANGGFGMPFNFLWSNNTITPPNTEGVSTATNLCAGNYSVTIVDAKGCKHSSTTLLNEPTKVVAATKATSNYGGFNVRCADSNEGEATASATGGNNNYRFMWLTTPRKDSVSVSGLRAGTYQVIATDDKGCRDTGAVEIKAPIILATAYETKNVRCFGEKNGDITIQNISGGVRPYSWTLAGKTLGDTTRSRFDKLIAGNYSLQITDANKCNLTRAIFLTEPPQMIPFSTADTMIHFGDEISLFVGLKTPSVLTAVKWTANRDSLTNIKCIDCRETVAAPRLPTIFKAILTDSFGCQITKEVLVQVDKRRKVFAPTAFSPNDDGANDRFAVFAGAGTRRVLSLRVFNRWGNSIFAKQNPNMYDDTDGWDGRINGRDLPSDVYIWIAEIEFEDGDKEIHKGDFSLMR